MNTMSDSATRLQPSPTAGPFTAATTGTRHATMPVTIWRPSASVSLAQVLVAGQLVEVGEVAAGRERPAVAGEHDGPGVEVGVDLREQLGQAVVQLVVGGVELLGPVEADDADRAVDLDLDLAAAGRSVVMRRAVPGCGGRRGCAGSARCRP